MPLLPYQSKGGDFLNILAVDDEEASLSLLNKAIQKVLPSESPKCFITAEEALDYAKQNPIDVAFVDIEMGSISGLDIARQLTKIKSDTNIIFVTGYVQYTGEAFEMHASGYVQKPVRAERIKRELDNLRYAVSEPSNLEKTYTLGAYTFEHTARRVYRNGEDTLLTPMEYSIFYTLASSPNTFFLAQDLYEKTSRLNANDELSSLYSHISRLRKKLGLDANGEENTIEIEQIRGKGYRLTIDNTLCE